MGERKVLNRYIPADFDPSIIPRVKRDRSKLIEVRTMLPFSLRCSTCGEYMYKGKKFNSRMERVEGDDYMGIRKYRFYIKCSVCSSEITFKTDPKNSDYECESGATRNFELWRDNEVTKAEADTQREEEEKLDSMKSLENRTIENKIEMDVLDALDEIKAINQRHERIDTNKLLEIQQQKSSTSTINQADLKSDEELIKSINFKSNMRSVIDESSTPKPNDIKQLLQQQILKTTENEKSVPAPPQVTIIKKRKITESSISADKIPDGKEGGFDIPPDNNLNKKTSAHASSAQLSQSLNGLLCGYGSGSSDASN